MTPGHVLRQLARRHAKRQRAPWSLRWGGLVSVWAHMGVGFLGLFVAGTVHLQPARLEVVRVQPSPTIATPEMHATDPRPGFRPAEPQPVEEVEKRSPLKNAERYVQTERPEVENLEAETISAHHTHAPRQVRSAMSTPHVGKLRPSTVSTVRGGGGRHPLPVEGTTESAMGNSMVAPVAKASHGAGGGGRLSAGKERSAADETGRARAGGQPATGGGAAGGGAHVGARVSLGGVKEGRAVPIRRDEIWSSKGSSNWQPIAARIRVSRPDDATEAEAEPGPIATHRSGGESRGLGKQDQDNGAAPSTLLTPEESARGEAASTRGTQRKRFDLTSDPVKDLREALGWGPIDRSKLAPRPEWANEMYERLGLVSTAPASPVADNIDWIPATNTRGTPLGEYVAELEKSVGRRWAESDLDPHSMALGIQGRTTVQYTVQRSGRVSDLAVVNPSGNAQLDAMALAAVPNRFPRVPKEVGSLVTHRVTLRYRNPIVPQRGPAK